MVLTGLQIFYRIPIAIGFSLALLFISIESVVPAVIAGIVYWKTRMAAFILAVVVAGVVVILWIWAFVLGQFSTFQ